MNSYFERPKTHIEANLPIFEGGNSTPVLLYKANNEFDHMDDGSIDTVLMKLPLTHLVKKTMR